MIEDLMFDIVGLSKTWPPNHWFPWKTFGGKPIVQYILLDYTQHILVFLFVFCLTKTWLCLQKRTNTRTKWMHSMFLKMSYLGCAVSVFLLGCSIGCFYVAFYHTDAAGKILQRHLVLLLLPLHTFSIYFISYVLLNWVLSSSSGKISVISFGPLQSCMKFPD